MSSSEASGGTGGGSTPGPGGGGPGGGGGPVGSMGSIGGGISAATTSTGERLKIIKTQLIPHNHHQQQLHQYTLHHQQFSPQSSPSSSPPIIPTTIPLPIPKPINQSNNNPSKQQHTHTLPPSTTTHYPPITMKNSAKNLYSLNPVAAKITHVKTTTIDAGGGINIGGAPTGGTGTIMTSGGGLSTAGGGAIKVSATGLGVGAVATSIGGPLNTSQSTTATALRAIGAGGQSTQVRVVMPTGMGIQTSMIKQLEGAAAGRTQITAIPAATRTVPNTSITVTRPVTQTTYLPRASVTATQMTGMGVGMTTAGQRLVTPIRATSATGAVTGLTAAGSFVRGTAVNRNSSSPATTVISPATSTTWMATNTTGQVQLIRTIPHQPRQRIITTQGITANTPGGVTVSGTVVATTPTASVQQISGPGQTQVQPTQSTIQTVSSQAGITTSHSQQQQTYVATLATVLPPRQHQATLVYSSNVGATSQPLSQPQFNPSVATGQRFAVATQLTAATGAGGAPRQIRPIPLGKSFSTTKLNTTSISIRAPNIPQLTPTLGTGGLAGSTLATGSANSPRNTTITGVATGAPGNVMPTTNLPTTRIIQLQQQPGGTTQQIIGSTGRLAGNVMLQPIIVNTSGSGKIGLRQPVTMATKVQPSLTITQLGRLPGTAGAGTGTLTQNVAASIQSIQSGVNTASPSISTATSSSATNLSTTATAQLVNVSQGTAGQLLTTQNIVSSAGGATVVPLAITTRGGAGGNILTGTITPIKNANAITVGKVQMATASMDGGASSGANAPTNVYIHQTNAAAQQRSLGGGGSNITSVGVGGATTVAVATSNATSAAGAATVLTSTGGGSIGGPSTSSAFLPPGSTIYYESVPASSVQVSTGVLSLTTTTVTSSTMSQNQIASSASSNLAISSLPFAPHTGNSTATFTVLPSSGGRTIGQLQIPVSSAGSQIQAVPVRFSAQLPTSVGGGVNSSADSITVSQAAQQLISSVGQQILIPAPPHQAGVTTTATLTGQQGQHMVIPLQTSIKVTSGGNPGNTTVVSNFLRKREAEGSPIRAAKNLGPTLLSMASGGVSTISSAAGSPAASSVGSTYSIASASSSSNTTVSMLTTEALAKKDRVAAGTAASGAVTSTSRTSRPDSPASSDGSTTVSANSSPGVDQQMQDGGFSRMPPGANDATHFNPINDLYSNHHHHSVVLHNIITTPTSSRRAPIDHQQLHVSSSTQRLNGSAIDGPQRKRSRRSTNDSQLSVQSQASLTLPPPSIASNMSGISSNNSDVAAMMGGGGAGESIHHAAAVGATGNGMLLAAAAAAAAAHDSNNATNNINHKTNNVPQPAGNKENAKPVEFVLRRPRNCTLLNSYKQSWKAANNHFQRYSDVKPREERRPTVIDLANQANIVGKINGWKVHHLRSQMEDLCENESLSYDKLSSMLKQMEAHEKNEETERVNELLKGNMQRSKIIVDGINEAQNQIMKIFEHKSHVNDIIQRCASKRNFKKREKL